MVFLPYKIFTIRTVPQIWRLITNFLITGPKFGMILDPYFLYTYASQLETSASRFSQPGDFFVYLVFCATVILVCFLIHPVFIICSLFPFLLCLRNLVLSARTALLLAVTVPGNEGDYPLHCAGDSIIRKTVKERLWSARNNGIPN